MTKEPDRRAIVPARAMQFGLAVALTATAAGYAAFHWWRTIALPNGVGAESKPPSTPAPEPGAASRGAGAGLQGHKHTNRLIHETSPYLLQHSHNPVHWYPWGTEALAELRLVDA